MIEPPKHDPEEWVPVFGKDRAQPGAGAGWRFEEKSSRRAHRSTPMAIPHFINDDRSEMRGIKSGWYAIDAAGNLSSGPFSSREQCLIKIQQTTNQSTSSTLHPHSK
jgi:hypothetical protein